MLASRAGGQTLTWTNVTPMNTARSYAAAVVLNDGKVLVTGGRDASNNVLSTAERYDPVAGTWTTISMVAGRWPDAGCTGRRSWRMAACSSSPVRARRGQL